MSINWCAHLPRDVGVVIVAAGDGTRLGGDVPKQFLMLAGVPVLLRAARPFVSHPEVMHVVVVLRPADAAAPPDWLAPLVGSALSIAAGGATRRESVAAGLACLAAEIKVVLVHDGARPFPPRAAIDGGIRAARSGVSAVPAIGMADTLKRADAQGRVTATVPREDIWSAQTPQAFPRTILVRAHAQPPTTPATDDAMLVESLGEPVVLVPGARRNLKITTPEDLALATWYANTP
jgi:2-C-methyl-D-erythritol 4-phosphate cytidylyltransferase